MNQGTNTFEPGGSFRFVGREAEMRCLIDAFEEAFSGRPKMVCLVGETGVGKTRIIQEFYRHLSSSPAYDPGCYWPDVLLEEDGSVGLNPPPPAVVQQNRPPWIWWGLRWGNPTFRNRTETLSALFDSATHLLAHLTKLEDTKANQRLIRSASLNAVVAFSNLFSLGLPGAVKDLVENFGLLKDARENRENALLPPEHHKKLAASNLAKLAFDSIVACCTKDGAAGGGIPIIMVLDDAQWSSRDITMMGFLKELLHTARKQHLKLLIIATYWPKEWQSHAAERDTFSLPLLCHGVPRSSHLEYQLLPVEGLPDMEALLSEWLPGLTAPQLALIKGIVEGNPMHANKMLNWLISKPHLFEGRVLSGPLTQAAEAQLLSNNRIGVPFFAQLAEEIVEQLPEDIRNALLAASFQGQRFFIDLVSAVGQISFGGADFDTALERAENQWLLISAITSQSKSFKRKREYLAFRGRLDEQPQIKAAIKEHSIDVCMRHIRDGWIDLLVPSDRDHFLTIFEEITES